MSSEKGKGKAPATEDKTPDPNSTTPSLFSRVTASATGLTRSAFATASGSDEINQNLSSALSNTGKSQGPTSSGAGSSAWAESSKSSSSFAQASSSSNGTTGLKAGHSEEHVQASENQFSDFLDGIDSFVPSSEPLHEPKKEQGGSDVAGLEGAWEHAQNAPPTSSYSEQVSIPSLTVAEQESLDGAEVLNLLSTSHSEFEAPPTIEEDENFDWQLSPEQLSAIRSLAPAPHIGVSTDNPVNLIPDFGQMTVEGRMKWREEWEGVLSRYSDEVWGGLGELVREARKEIEDLKEGEGEVREEPKALRRLGAILAHLQGRR